MHVHLAMAFVEISNPRSEANGSSSVDTVERMTDDEQCTYWFEVHESA